jgi:hypothetical protein
MTYNTKNATIVIAFAAVLLAWPMAAQNAFAGDIVDANMNAECGFSTTNLASLDFGNFVPTDSESGNALEQEIQLDQNGASSARVLITIEDWVTIGTRASGEIEILGAPTLDDEVVVGAKTYLAKTTGATGQQFDIGATNAETALNLATAIRTEDAANFKVSTAGTAIVTVNTVARGTALNTGTVLSEDTAGARIETRDSGDVTTTNDMDGAVDTALTIMDGDTTKYSILVGSTATSAYGAKVPILTVGAAQEALGGTTEENIYLALEIDPATATFNAAALPYDGAITQDITIAVDAACDGTE